MMDQFTIKELFDRLDIALSSRRLNTSKGTRRRVRANEFQLYIRTADAATSGYTFIHRATHAKIVFDPRSTRLVVRDTDVFDEFTYTAFVDAKDRQGE
jgi:hypothetical protein